MVRGEVENPRSHVTVNVVLSTAAERDVRVAFRWYEDRVSSLGSAFLDEVEASLARIAEFPAACPTVHQNVRRALLRRFPYGVFYLIEASRAVVLAVLHQAQDPERWTKLD